MFTESLLFLYQQFKSGQVNLSVGERVSKTTLDLVGPSKLLDKKILKKWRK